MNTKMPVVRPLSWLLVLPQFAVIAACIAAVHVLLAPSLFLSSLIAGCAVYILYSITSRRLAIRAHRVGVRHTMRGQFAEAISHFQRSYDFFSRHPWIDKYRCLTFMSPSAMSYREMALVNIAACYSQLGNAAACKEYYAKALSEFPGSLIARTSMNFIYTIEALAKTDQPAAQPPSP